MKLPNGSGTVVKQSGKRRNPYYARVTTGWELDEATGKVRQIRKIIGYYPTKKLALEALMAYNSDPYDLDAVNITFAELYEKWSAEHFQTIVPSATRTWKSAYRHSEPLHNMRMKDIRVSHLEGAIQTAEVSDSIKARMKSLFNLMYKYAMKHEIVNKNYAELCASVKPAKSKKQVVPFTGDEIKTLWEHIDIPFADMILVGIYSGWRPGELAVLKVEDVDLDQMTMKGGLKTEAGKNRIVPIHPAIEAIIRKHMTERPERPHTLFYVGDENMTYDKYHKRFNKVMEALQMDHHTHETRHTFITLAKRYGMDEYLLKLIVGHSIKDLTEKVYTHRTIDQLRDEIKKIPLQTGDLEG